jgi:hypothetical protein
MLYTVHTKSGMGVELWGTYDDLVKFYDTINRISYDESKYSIKGYENRDDLISSFSYELRKAFEQLRLSRDTSHFSHVKSKHYGAKFSWVHILFAINALRYNCRFASINSLDLSMFLQLEYWLENAMNSYDNIGALKLKRFIDAGLYMGNEFVYQYMLSINIDYFKLGKSKASFRSLPKLLERGVLFSEEYNNFLEFLKRSSKELNVSISQLEIKDDDIEYGKLL